MSLTTTNTTIANTTNANIMEETSSRSLTILRKYCKDDEDLEAMIHASPSIFWQQVTSLDISCNDIGAKGAQAIASSLPHLTDLNIYHNKIGAKGAQAIASSLPHLTDLNISRNMIGVKGARAIASSYLPHLTDLNISRNYIWMEGIRALVPLLQQQLTSLDISNNYLGVDCAMAIASSSSSSSSQLTRLDIRDNRIGNKGAVALASLYRLTSLDVSRNFIGDEGAQAIASLPFLIELDISNNNVGRKGLRTLVESLSNLTSLLIHGNNSNLSSIFQMRGCFLEIYKHVQEHLPVKTKLYRKAQGVIARLHKELQCLHKCKDVLMEQVLGIETLTISLETAFVFVVICNILVPQTLVEISIQEKYIEEYESQNGNEID